MARWIGFCWTALLLQVSLLGWAPPAAKFRNYGVDEGLLGSQISDILCDRQGLMWFATDLGLYRFDGQRFVRYYSDGVGDSLQSNHLTQIVEDAAGDFWIATRGAGLQYFDRRRGVFRAYGPCQDAEGVFTDNNLYSLASGPSGMIWTASIRGGLEAFDPRTERVTHYDFSAFEEERGLSAAAFSVLEDRDGVVWLGTRSAGLWRIDPRGGDPLVFKPEKGDARSFPARLVMSLYQDRGGFIWVGGRYSGLTRLDPKTLTWRSYAREVPGRSVYQCVQDQDGRLWVATQDAGLSCIEPGGPDAGDSRVRHLSAEADPDFAPAGEALLALADDRRGGIWLGTHGSGAVRYDRLAKPFINYRNHDLEQQQGFPPTVANINPATDGGLWVAYFDSGLDYFDLDSGAAVHYNDQSDDLPLTSNNVKSVAEDGQGGLYVGYWDRGLDYFHRPSGAKTHYQADPEDDGSLSGRRVYQVLPEQDRVYVATYDGGLCRLNLSDGRFTRFPVGREPGMLRNRAVMTMHRGPSGTLWLGTLSSGLARVDEEQVRFELFMHDENAANSLSHNDVIALHESRDGLLWIGTMGGGLESFDPQRGLFRRIRDPHGRLSTSISNITEDADGYLWLSDTAALLRFDPVSGQLDRYNRNDGIAPAGFANTCVVGDGHGGLIFGGGAGVVRFEPSQIQRAAQVPPVVIENISLGGRSLAFQAGRGTPWRPLAPLAALPEFTDALTISETERTVRFDFTAYQYRNAANMAFRYRLEPFEDAWRDGTDAQRFVQYTNLTPGHYAFHVQADNGEGVWNTHGAVLRLHVRPAWYWSPLSKTLYFLVVAVLLGLYLRLQRLKLAGQKLITRQAEKLAGSARDNAAKDRQLARETQKVADQLGRLDRLKDEFLANTSHELRTPLQGMIGLSEALLEGDGDLLSARARNDLGLIVNEGRRLALLVNDLLDFSQLKHHNLALHLKPVDVHSLVAGVLALTEVGLFGRDLKLVNAVPADLPAVAADEERLQQIFHNLVGNAVKFTPHGEVRVGARIQDHQIHMWVSDTGIGIAPQHQQLIFEDFFQLDGSDVRRHGGTGLGLSITKGLIAQLGGHLHLESELGRGAVFSFALPVASDRQPVAPSAMRVPGSRVSEVSPAGRESATPNGFHVLVVDDERVNREVLQRHLESAGYRVTTVGNGSAALAALGPEIDIVLLDVMMPGMSGFEVCRQIRAEHPLQALPVLFLTAKAGLGDLVQAFQMGGNDFLTKPVAREELLARLNTQRVLLDLHRNLEDKVADRTQRLSDRNSEVEAQHRELEHLYHIVQGLNHLVFLDEVFEALLQQGLRLFGGATRAAMMVRQGDRFSIVALAGYPSEESPVIRGVVFPTDVVLHHYLERGEEIGTACYRLRGPAAEIPLAAPRLREPSRSLLALAMILEGEVAGLLIFSNTEDASAFDEVELNRLERFREHAVAAVQRAQLMREIQIQKEAIVQNQEIIIRQQKLASLGTLTAGLAHEINNPINFIQGGRQAMEEELTAFRRVLLSLLGDQPDDELLQTFDAAFDKLHQNLALIGSGSSRIGEIIENLMQLTHLDDSGPQSVLLTDSIEGAISVFRNRFPLVQFTLTAEPDAWVLGRAEVLDHVLMNLVRNACQAFSEGNERDAEVRLDVCRVDQGIQLTVADNGCGMPAERVDKAFDAFFTSREPGQGLGLGLFTSHQMVTDLGGSMQVASEPGRGSVFTIIFPAAAFDTAFSDPLAVQR